MLSLQKKIAVSEISQLDHDKKQPKAKFPTVDTAVLTGKGNVLNCSKTLSLTGKGFYIV